MTDRPVDRPDDSHRGSSGREPRFFDDEREPLTVPAGPLTGRVVAAAILGVLVLVSGLVIAQRATGPAPVASSTYQPPTLDELSPSPGTSASGTPGQPSAIPSYPAVTDPADTVPAGGALGAWYTSVGLPLVLELDDLVTRTRAAIDARDLVALTQECRSLDALSDRVAASPPPADDSTATTEWAAATESAAAAARDCAAAIGEESVNLARVALEEARQALDHARRAAIAARPPA